MEPKQAIRFDHVDYKIDDTKILKDINHGFNQGKSQHLSDLPELEKRR